MSALEVNGNGGTNGDGYMSATLVLEEEGDNVSTDGLDPWEAPLRLGDGGRGLRPSAEGLLLLTFQADPSIGQPGKPARGMEGFWHPVLRL